MVKMSHVDDAINEMFQATHMQMMRNCCRLEKMLLASIHMESRAKGQHSTHCHDSSSPTCTTMFLAQKSGSNQSKSHVQITCLRTALLHCM